MKINKVTLKNTARYFFVCLLTEVNREKQNTLTYYNKLNEFVRLENEVKLEPIGDYGVFLVTALNNFKPMLKMKNKNYCIFKWTFAKCWIETRENQVIKQTKKCPSGHFFCFFGCYFF